MSPTHKVIQDGIIAIIAGAAIDLTPTIFTLPIGATLAAYGIYRLWQELRRPNDNQLPQP